MPESAKKLGAMIIAFFANACFSKKMSSSVEQAYGAHKLSLLCGTGI